MDGHKGQLRIVQRHAVGLLDGPQHLTGDVDGLLLQLGEDVVVQGLYLFPCLQPLDQGDGVGDKADAAVFVKDNTPLLQAL